MNNTIRVVMLGSYPLQTIYGGVENHFYHLAHHIVLLKDVELHIVTLGDTDERFEKNNIHFHVMLRSKFRPFCFLDIMKLRKKILEINPDLIHAQATSIIYTPLIALVRKRYLLLLTVHGLEKEAVKFQRGFHRFMSKFIRIPLEKYAISKADNIIAVSLHVKNSIKDMARSKIYVIPNGVDFENMRDANPDKSIDHPSILYVGMLYKLKGIDILLHAAQSIIKKFPNLHVYIAGSGPEEDNLKKLVKKLKIGENVKFLGVIHGDKKYSYYKSADVCVFPSTYDPFGIVVLEAMVSAKPVIVSNVRDVPLPLPFMMENKKTGLLFECGDFKDLAEKVIFLLQNEELRKKMGEAGRERAKEFTWDKIAEQTVAVYKEIVMMQKA